MSSAAPAASRPPECGLRIGILCHGAGSGSTRVALDLAQALHRRGHGVLLLTLGPPRWRIMRGLPHVSLSRAGFPCGLDDEWTAGHIRQLAAALEGVCGRANLDLLHYHYGFPFAEACHVLRGGRRGLALVATLHGSDILRAVECTAARARLREALDAAEAVVTVSRPYADRLSSMLGRDCRLVPNFLPAERQRPRRPRIHPAVPAIVHVSNFRAVKQVHQVGQAFIALRRQRRCRLLLVGDGPQRRALQGLLQGFGDDVCFFGRMDDPLPVLHMSHAMLLASRAESFSLAALEAMAAGVPVVAPRIAGLVDTVVDGAGGLLYTPGRPLGAAAKLLLLMESQHRYRALARSARAVSGRYGEDRSVAAYLAIYAEAAGT